MSDDMVQRLEARAFRLAARDMNGDGAKLALEARDRIKELEAKLRASALQELAALGQAHDAHQAQLEAEAKLAKAAAMALEECPFRWGTKSYNDWWQDRRSALAELTGGKDE